MFAWGVFFPLVLREPLWAALLGVVVPLLAVYAVRPRGLERGDVALHRLIFRRSVFCLVLLAVDAGLAQLWFRGKLDVLRVRLWWPAGSDESVAAVQPLIAVLRRTVHRLVAAAVARLARRTLAYGSVLAVVRSVPATSLASPLGSHGLGIHARHSGGGRHCLRAVHVHSPAVALAVPHVRRTGHFAPVGLVVASRGWLPLLILMIAVSVVIIWIAAKRSPEPGTTPTRTT